MKNTFLQDKKVLFGGIILAVVLVFGLVTLSRNQNPSNDSGTPETTFVDINPSGINYPSGWQESTQISTLNKNAGVVSDTTRSNPNAHIVVRAADNELEKDFNIQSLPDQVISGLQTAIGGFQLVDKKITKIGDYPAVQLDYKDQSAEDQKIYFDRMYIVPTEHKTFYVTYRVDDADLSKIEKDMTGINTALAQYIKTHL